MPEESTVNQAASSSKIMQKLFARNPLLGFLEPDRLTINTDNSVEISFVAQPKHTNVYGIVHGGVFTTLLDTVMGYSCHLWKKAHVVTLNLDASFIANCKAGARINITGRPVHDGQRVIVSEGEVRDESGTLLVVSQGSFFVLDEQNGQSVFS